MVRPAECHPNRAGDHHYLSQCSQMKWDYYQWEWLPSGFSCQPYSVICKLISWSKSYILIIHWCSVASLIWPVTSTVQSFFCQHKDAWDHTVSLTRIVQKETECWVERNNVRDDAVTLLCFKTATTQNSVINIFTKCFVTVDANKKVESKTSESLMCRHSIVTL